MHIRPAQFLGGDLLAGRGLHQRRPGKENGALTTNDHRLVAHCRNIGSPGGAGPHDRGDLWDSGGRQVRLVEEFRPKCSRSGKISSCSGRNAPPESTR